MVALAIAGRFESEPSLLALMVAMAGYSAVDLNLVVRPRCT